jgi:16S rRNA (cytosine967-C5)-methyltransferase
MGGMGKIRSADIHRHKTTLIQHGADRLGLSNVLVREQDATENHPTWLGKMDVVLCDVPCSGYGIIRKKPDIRYKDPAQMDRLPELQLKILSKQAQYVKPGGTVIYSTCTLVRNENENVVRSFLKHHPEFYLEPLPLPENFPVNESGMIALVPGQYDTDGFFIARLRRKAEV